MLTRQNTLELVNKEKCMYIPNPYFKDVPNMGNLEMDYIFFENGYPVLFTCKNDERMFLCVCRTIIDEQKWVIAEIGLNTLVELMENKISIRDAFKKDNINACIVHWTKNNPIEKYDVVVPEKISDGDLPEEDIFLDDYEESIEYLTEIKNRIGEYLYVEYSNDSDIIESFVSKIFHSKRRCFSDTKSFNCETDDLLCPCNEYKRFTYADSDEECFDININTAA